MRRGTSVKIVVTASLAAILMGGCVIHTDAFKAKFSRSQDLTAPLTDITALDVSTNVGKIQLEAADVAEVRIAAEIKVKARTEERAQELAEQVRIVAEPTGQTLTIKAVKPAGLRDSDLSVDFTITAPGDLALTCTTDVGDIRTKGFTKRVKASADVGAIEFAGPQEISARVTATTSVGNITTDRPITVSGSFKRSLRGSLGKGEGQIDLSTNVGAIRIR